MTLKHQWSGWPGAFCLNCGTEDRAEADLVGNHRYTDAPHTGADCVGCSTNDDECPGPRKPDQREEHMRTALILSRVADSLEDALKGRARFEVREEAYDRLAQARRRLRDCDAILWPK